MAEDSAAPAAPSAGALLRQAREAQGLHIAALAASLKVPVRKLEALERDRLDELPDATFARALAQTVCRALKVDPAPVLALLPRADAAALDQVASGINAPFREKPSAASEPAFGVLLRHPATAIVGVLLAGAAAVLLWPAASPPAVTPPLSASSPASTTTTQEVPTQAAQPAQPSAVPASQAASVLVETVHAAPPPGDPAASLAGAASASGLLTLRTDEASWVEVVDGAGQTLLSRVVQPGESVGLDGALPLRVVVGNASATQVAFRGRTMDLTPLTRDNVARLELK